jgi:cell division protein FtsQ
MTLPNLRYDRIFWVLFLLIIGLVLLSSIRNRKRSFVEDTVVEIIPLNGGDKLISESNVKQLLLRAFGNTLEDTELSALEIDRMEHVIEEDPFVKNADVYVDQNNGLHVRIDQRNPILRVLDSSGNNYYLDENGAKMPPSNNFAAHVLVATGNVSPYSPDFLTRKRTTLKDAFQVTQTIMADEFLSGFIQQVHVRNVNGNNEFFLVPLIGDQLIQLGSARHLADKLERLKIFYKQGMPYAGWRKYSVINLKFAGQVVCDK